MNNDNDNHNGGGEYDNDAEVGVELGETICSDNENDHILCIFTPGLLYLRGLLGALLHPKPGGEPLLGRRDLLPTHLHVRDGALAGSVMSAGNMPFNRS